MVRNQRSKAYLCPSWTKCFFGKKHLKFVEKIESSHNRRESSSKSDLIQLKFKQLLKTKLTSEIQNRTLTSKIINQNPNSRKLHQVLTWEVWLHFYQESLHFFRQNQSRRNKSKTVLLLLPVPLLKYSQVQMFKFHRRELGERQSKAKTNVWKLYCH